MKALAHLLHLFSVLALLFHISDFASAGTLPEDSYIESILAGRIESYANQAIVVGLVDSNSRRVISGGTFDGSVTPEVDGNTLFEIGSITKVFTSLILAEMAENGELNLDDPIKNFLPDTVKVPVKNGVEITLSHLSSHSSGLPLWPTNLTDDYTPELLYEFLSGYELNREPGAQAEYSNLGAGLLGHILALKTGLSSEELFIERVCQPLNLDDTLITVDGDLIDRLATGHDADGSAVGITSDSSNVLYLAAGALRSTANDMLTFLEANLGHSESDLYSAMLNTHIPRADITPPALSSGLAWFVQRQFDSEIIWHSGATEGFRSFIGFDKEKDLGVVVLTNSANDIQDIGMHLLNDNYELAGLHQEIDMNPGILDTYSGMYEFAKGVYATVSRKGGELWVQFTGEPPLRVFPFTETDFFYKAVSAEISFEVNDNDVVTGMIYRQSGTEYPIKRLDAIDTVPVPTEMLDSYAGKYRHREITDYIFTIEVYGDSIFGYPPDSQSKELTALSDTYFLIQELNVVIMFNHDSAGAVESLTLFVGGGYAVLDNMDQTSVSEENVIPEELTLSHNRPNPFNPSTLIEYSILTSSHVELTVYTLAGQKVATLVDGPMPAGSHSTVFNGSGLASGVYIYKLNVENSTKSGRMSLVK